MRNLISIILILIATASNAQKLFINSNGETCVELYVAQDPLKEYVVCLVVENLTPTDSTVLRRWNQFNMEERSAWTQEWAWQGYRIEAVNLPIAYIKHQPFLKP